MKQAIENRVGTNEWGGPCGTGYQPVLDRGTEFSYTSQAPLRRLKGSMKGSYTMVGQTTGELLEAAVGAFALSPPRGAAGKRKGRRGGRARGVGDKDSAGEEVEVVRATE